MVTHWIFTMSWEQGQISPSAPFSMLLRSWHPRSQTHVPSPFKAAITLAHSPPSKPTVALELLVYIRSRGMNDIFTKVLFILWNAAHLVSDSQSNVRVTDNTRHCAHLSTASFCASRLITKYQVRKSRKSR